MERIRSRLLLLICWITGLFQLQNVLPIDLSPEVYLLAIGIIILSLLVPRLYSVSWVVTFASSITLLLAIKLVNGTLEVTNVLSVALVEACILAITTTLVYSLAGAIFEFESAVSKITFGKSDSHSSPVRDFAGEGYIYREVRRARNHQRPLALIAISIDEKTMAGAVDRILQEAQQAMLKRLTLTSVSRMLSEKLEDCDIVVQAQDHFLVALPETHPEDLDRIIERLRHEAYEKMGVQLMIGAANFPSDGQTLEGLMQKATQKMTTDQELPVSLDFDQLVAEHHTP